MTNREFTLPGIQDLNKEQEDARALPKQGQHLIIGGPGTGKSVLALLRARRHQQENDNYVFLVYNTLLKQASYQLFGKDLKSKQWQAWFRDTFEKIANQPIPRCKGNRHQFDWKMVSAIIAALPHTSGVIRPFLIVDEGQDMPLSFYHALANLGFENFFVVADGNQQIIPAEGSKPIPEIAGFLGYQHHIPDGKTEGDWLKTNDDGTTEKLIDLLENYRNTYPIAKLAREFYTDSTSRLPNLPVDRPSTIRPLLHAYPEDKFSSIIINLLKNADRNPAKLIGIITPDNDVRNRYFNALNSAQVKLDNGRPRIVTYSSNDIPNENLHFNKGGIMVINAQSCKGLEFDTVFLADINEYRCNAINPDQTKRLFYVMVARAKDMVVMLKKANSHCPVDAILPKDTTILERK
jgi:superfamily I DNA/RNA helicase